MKTNDLLFRGRSKLLNGGWKYGLLYIHKNDTSILVDVNDNNKLYYVYPDSVGKYAHFTDSSGNKAFTDDVIKTTPVNDAAIYAVVREGFYNDPDKILKTHYGVFFDWIGDYSYLSYLRKDIGFWLGQANTTIEIIGNTFDNPETTGGIK